jgi:3,4-dihydroxy 2-butanone 4-phosphate synthase/GTP cyclohydrolase II
MLKLPLMTQDNKDALRTAYTISVDAADGVTTVISAKDRARTLREAAVDLLSGGIAPSRRNCRSHRLRRGHYATSRTACFRPAEGGLPVVSIRQLVERLETRDPQQQQPDLTHPVSTSEYLIGHTKEETSSITPPSQRTWPRMCCNSSLSGRAHLPSLSSVSRGSSVATTQEPFIGLPR